MAENTTPNPSPNPPQRTDPKDTNLPTGMQQSQRTSPQAKGKVTIRATHEDGVLEPDAMRGSPDYLKDLDVEDLEEERRETQRELSEQKRDPREKD